KRVKARPKDRAPEASGIDATPGPAADVYGLGRLLLRCLGESHALPDDVARLVADATSREPANRIPDVGAFLSRLANLDVDALEVELGDEGAAGGSTMTLEIPASGTAVLEAADVPDPTPSEIFIRPG